MAVDDCDCGSLEGLPTGAGTAWLGTAFCVDWRTPCDVADVNSVDPEDVDGLIDDRDDEGRVPMPDSAPGTDRPAVTSPRS